MKKKVFGKKLSRDRGSRRALYRSLARALIMHGQIKTTYAKAKALKPEIEKLVSLAKKNGISERRRVLSELANDRRSVDALFDKIAAVFSEKKSGFTRIVKLPERSGDRSAVVRLEWSQKIATEEKGSKTKEKELKKPTPKGLKGKVLERAEAIRKSRQSK